MTQQPWIQHFSRTDIRDGLHYDHGKNKTVLIQIKDATDPPFVIPCRKDDYVTIYQFMFDDIDDWTQDECIQQNQADSLVQILRSAYDNRHNVLVHCHAGICRSSAVAIIGEKIGFQLEHRSRLPNKLVMQRMFLSLGMEDESEKIKNGYLSAYRPDDWWEGDI